MTKNYVSNGLTYRGKLRSLGIMKQEVQYCLKTCVETEMSCLKIGIADLQMWIEANQRVELTVKMRSRSRSNEI